MANINIRIDDDLKEESRIVLDELGLDLSTGIKLFLNQVVRQKGIPFELTLNVPMIVQADNDFKNGNVATFNTLDELFKDLDDENQ